MRRRDAFTENDLGKIQEAISNTANEYIMKPFDVEILRTKFNQLGIEVKNYRREPSKNGDASN